MADQMGSSSSQIIPSQRWRFCRSGREQNTFEDNVNRHLSDPCKVPSGVRSQQVRMHFVSPDQMIKPRTQQGIPVLDVRSGFRPPIPRGPGMQSRRTSRSNLFVIGVLLAGGLYCLNQMSRSLLTVRTMAENQTESFEKLATAIQEEDRRLTDARGEVEGLQQHFANINRNRHSSEPSLEATLEKRVMRRIDGRLSRLEHSLVPPSRVSRPEEPEFNTGEVRVSQRLSSASLVTGRLGERGFRN